MVETLKTVLSDAQWTIDRLAENADAVIAELTLRGRHTGPFRGHVPRGGLIEVRCYRTFVFSGDRIVEHSALLDTTRLLKQMAPHTA